MLLHSYRCTHISIATTYDLKKDAVLVQRCTSSQALATGKVAKARAANNTTRRTLRIIQPDLSYAEALVALDITSLYERRQALSKALFNQIVRDQSHKLHELLLPRNGSTYCTRSQGYFKLPICKTNRFKNTFIIENSFNY